MNRNRKKGSDSDQSSVVSGKGMARNKAVAGASEWPGESEPSPKRFGSSKASSIRSYRTDDDEKDFSAPKKVGNSSKASSIRSYRMDDDEKDVPTPKKVGSSSKASSIRSYRMDDDDKDIIPHVSMGPVHSPYARNTATPRIEHNAIYSDPYAALRIADTSRRSNDLENSYTHTPIRIAADSQLNRKSSTSGNEDVNTDPYVALKIAGSRRRSADLGEILYDSNDSSGFEEDIDSSDNEDDEQLDDEDLADGGGDSGSEEGDDEVPANNARVSVAGSESGQVKDGGYFPGYARVSAAGSSGDYGKNIGREFSGYARVSIAGGESDHANDGDERFQGYARVSAPASDVVYARDTNSKGSRAGSEADHGNGNYPKVSVAGNKINRGQDVYARLSVAGGVDMDTTAYARVCSVGSAVDDGKDAYARIHVAESEAICGNGFDREVSGRERLTVVQNQVDHVIEDNRDKDQEPGDNEHAAYLELSPELQAKLQYRVRVVLISPRFELKKRKLSKFLDIYKSKFGVDDGNFGFSSVASLCRAMPSIIQRKQSEDDEELVLVDSIENRRAVSGIRSGLRRIVYDALNSVEEELTCAELEGKCSELLGKPLVEVLSEHGYDTPTLESLIKDMPDIACFKEAGLESRVYVCTGAEDPALTDGLLVKSAAVASINTPKTAERRGVISEVEEAGEVAKESGHLKIGTSVTLRSLKNEFGRPEGFSLPSVSTLDDEFLQIRLRMRILLAFYNSGHGVEARQLADIYAKTFGQILNLDEFGFKSIMELARHWQDIFLLQESKPGWVCLVPSQANRRILNTLRTGLRSSVFSVLVEAYPEGLDPLDFLHRLQEGMSGELWEVLEATGYICSDTEQADSILSSSTSSDFQLVDFEEICLLLDDMMDFVRLGSNEDGSAVVKLRNGEVPLVDLLDCKLNESDTGSFDELFMNLMIIAVDVTDTSVADDGASGNDGFISVGHVQSLVKSFEGAGCLRSAHSQETESLRLKHELRLILGCPEYSESGLALNEFSNVYKGRTGQELGSKAKVRSLLRAMPDVVSKDSLLGDVVHLSKTPKNLRILSTTSAGLRQVLFWAMVKNPGGIWANLLEGWFTDFSGVSLAATLQMHGYEMSKSKPFFSVHVFLKDMSDLLQKKPAPLEVYTWAGEVKDPVHNDASLLGFSELLIQYDPLKFKLEQVSKREVEPVEEIVDKSVLKEDEGPRETDCVSNAVLGNSLLKEGKGDAKVGWEEEPSLSATSNQDESDTESNLDGQGVDQPFVEEERRGKEIHHVESGEELGSGEVEGPDGQKETVESKSREEFGSVESEGPVAQQGGLERNGDLGNVLDAPTIEGTNGEQHAHSDGKDGPVSEENEQTAQEDGNHLPQIEGNRVRSTSEAYAQLRVAQKGPKVKLDAQQSDSDGEDEPDSGESAESEEAAAEDESHLPQIEGDQLRSTSEAYAQLRVTGKGPKVNLDEWQFTDSEDEEEAEESGEEEGEEEEGEEEEEEEGDEEYEGGEEDEDDDKNAKVANTIQEPGQTLPTGSYVGPKVKEAGKDASRARVLPNKGLPWK